MSGTEKIKPFAFGGFMLLLGSSLLAHIYGSWLSLTIIFEVSGQTQGVVGSLIGSLFSVLVMMPLTLGAWFFVTLPLSALCMHSGVNQKVFITTLIGAISGALLMLVAALFNVGGLGEMVESILSFSLTGGFIAAVFSLMTKKWGKQSK